MESASGWGAGLLQELRTEKASSFFHPFFLVPPFTRRGRMFQIAPRGLKGCALMEWNWNSNAISWLSAAGIMWDLSGAIALARGFFFNTDEQLGRQFGSYYGANPSAYRAFFEQRLDTKFGLSQLLFGFLLQFFAACGISTVWSTALLFAAPIAPAWFVFITNRTIWAAVDAVRLSVTPDAQELTWRKHFSDLSDLQWKRIILNHNVVFTPPPASLSA